MNSYKKYLMVLQLILITLFSIIISFPAMTQSKEQNEIEQAVELLKTAMVNGKQQQLEDLVMDNLTYGHSGGKVENKKAFVEAFVSGNSNFEEIELTEQSVIISDNTAIVRHKLSGKTNDKGKEPGTVHLSVLLVWQKQKTQWKLLARQAVKI